MSQKFGNSCSTILASGITATTTSILVNNGAVFPAIDGIDPDEFMQLTMEDANGLFEIVTCTEHAAGSNVFIVVRAQEDTGAIPDSEGYPFSASDRFELRLTAAAMGQFLQRDGDVIDGGTY